MSRCYQAEADRCLGRITRGFFWIGLFVAGGVVLACPPEIKRYAKIGSM